MRFRFLGVPAAGCDRVVESSSHRISVCFFDISISICSIRQIDRLVRLRRARASRAKAARLAREREGETKSAILQLVSLRARFILFYICRQILHSATYVSELERNGNLVKFVAKRKTLWMKRGRGCASANNNYRCKLQAIRRRRLAVATRALAEG